VLWSVVGGTLSVSERYLFEGDAVRFFEDATAFGADLDATSSVCGAPLATFGAAPPFCTDRSRDGRAPLEVEDAAAAGFVFFDLLTSSPGDASFLGGDALLARFAEDGLLEGALATSDLEAGGSARTTSNSSVNAVGTLSETPPASPFWTKAWEKPSILCSRSSSWMVEEKLPDRPSLISSGTVVETR